ncbi:unnamed protein product [Brachionus calyciflorus]|uniref:G-protein coupled receptors family 1 profile domain-containing protein n=1 Tax=Brachionus calyciflorus TaxID=104777 RepID=A0A813W6C0_9BILA|nr:unnamed protein product [Brachionus calyciflorus]
MFVHEHWQKFLPINPHWLYFVASVNSIIGLIGFLLNFLVIHYLLKVYRTKRREKLYFLVNLAIADIVKVSINIPMNVISGYNGKWMFGKIGCSIYGIAGGLFGFISITTLAFMSFERYMIVQNPLNTIKLGKKFRLNCILITWIYSAFFIIIELFSKNGFILEGVLISCSFDYLSRDRNSRLTMLIMSIGGFVLPFFVIMVFYFLTKKALKSRGKYFYKRRVSLSTTLPKVPNDQKKIELGTSNIRYSQRYCIRRNCVIISDKLFEMKQNQLYLIEKCNYSSFLRRDTLVLKKIILCVLFFVLSWMPYALVTQYAQYGNNINWFLTPKTIWFPTILAKTSSIYNPIIYTQLEVLKLEYKLYLPDMEKIL